MDLWKICILYMIPLPPSQDADANNHYVISFFHRGIIRNNKNEFKKTNTKNRYIYMYIMNIIVLQIWENRQVNAFRMLITIWDDLTHWVHMIFTRTPSPPQWPLQGRQGEKQYNCWWRADQTLRHLNVSYLCWRSVAWAVFKMVYFPLYWLVHRDHESICWNSHMDWWWYQKS